MEIVNGFSKLDKDEKIAWLNKQLSHTGEDFNFVKKFWHENTELQKVFDEFSENTISNYLDFGIFQEYGHV